MTAETGDTLDRAADRIERVGWWQGSYSPSIGTLALRGAVALLRDRREPCCVTGAIWIEAADDFIAWMAIGALETLLGEAPAEWNDHPDRQAPEVIAVLRVAARRERAS